MDVLTDKDGGRRVAERSFVWLSCFRHLGRYYERPRVSLQPLHFVAFAWFVLARHTQILI